MLRRMINLIRIVMGSSSGTNTPLWDGLPHRWLAVDGRRRYKHRLCCQMIRFQRMADGLRENTYWCALTKNIIQHTTTRWATCHPAAEHHHDKRLYPSIFIRVFIYVFILRHLTWSAITGNDYGYGDDNEDDDNCIICTIQGTTDAGDQQKILVISAKWLDRSNKSRYLTLRHSDMSQWF